MKQSDLKYGNVIETNDDKRFLYICVEDKSKFVLLNYVSDFMSLYLNTKEPVDIVKVYKDYKCDKVIWKKKTKPKLSDMEKGLLKGIDSEYKFLCRDERDGILYAYKIKPVKNPVRKTWCTEGGVKTLYPLSAFNHLFTFITWEDEEAWAIVDLLKED